MGYQNVILWLVGVLIIYITTASGQRSNTNSFQFPQNQFGEVFRRPQPPRFFGSQLPGLDNAFPSATTAQRFPTPQPPSRSPTTTSAAFQRRPGGSQFDQRPRNRLGVTASTTRRTPFLVTRQQTAPRSQPTRHATRPPATGNLFPRFVAPNHFAGFPARSGGRTETPRGTTRNPNFPSEQTILEIRRETREFINTDAEWLPNLVQLVFHTCIGGCDGCLNFAERDNRGLRDTYATVRRRWLTTQGRFLSLADFVVLMGTEAAEIGLTRSEEQRSKDPKIGFEPGRITCRDPDNYHLRHRFPKGDDTDSVQYLIDEFGYSDRRMAIALLGAHSLGECKIENLGFAGRWDNTPLVLDNHYYKSLTETDFWTAVPVSNTFQWNSTEPDGPVMLHSDIALIHSFQLDENKRPNCARSLSCSRAKDSGRVSIYAHSFNVWVRDFIPAFLQMVSKTPAH
ncbi:putative ascorbate peroxidase [Watersipora subatra]|uniref:putative ascorbate peroxidase n=1 Tax=Watersipora subatra TaxID=2589382 RepID=UPI00355B56B1